MTCIYFALGTPAFALNTHKQRQKLTHKKLKHKQRNLRTLGTEAVQLKEQLTKEEVDRFVQILRRNF